jgi:PAS domain S-box-containing protein/putative nucleotidyltransferase with HDIG domain
MEGLAFQADKALLDAVFDGIAVIDLKTLRISLANKAAAHILGFDDPEELVAADPFRHIRQEDRERITAILTGPISGDCLQAGTEMRVLDRRGKDIWIMARGVKLASNGSSAILASFRDITAQKQADKALREAAERQTHLLNASNELILISQDWKIVFANRRLQEATGLSAEALNGMPFLDLTHPDDRQAVAQRYQKTLDGMYLPSDKAFKGIGKDGKPAWGMMRHVPFTWQGKAALMTIVQDITERKQAEEDLRHQEQLFRLLAENSSDLVVLINPDGTIRYESPAVERILGFTPEERVGTSLLERLHPDDVRTVSDSFSRMVKNPKAPVDHNEVRLRHKDGSWRVIEAAAGVIVRDSTVEGIILNLRDITERKKAQEALLRIGKAVDASSDAIGMSDAGGHHFYHNQAFTDLFEYTPEELEAAGGGPAAYADQNVAREVFSAIMGGGSWSGEVQMVSKSGRRFPVLLHADAIKDESGMVIGLVGVHTDISERMAARRALEQSEKKYRALAEESIQGLAVAQGMPPRFVYCNAAVARMTGYTVDELLSMSPEGFAGLIHPDDREAVFRRFMDPPKEAATEERRQIRGIRRDGTVVWLELSATVVEYEGAPAVQAAFVDITKRKKAEEALGSSEEKYRTLIQSIQDAIFIIKDGKIRYANKGFATIVDCSVEELIGKGIEDLVAPEDLAMVAGYYVRRMNGEQVPNEYEFRLVKKDGVTRADVRMSVGVITYEGGRAAMGTGHDITERKRAALALKESEEKFKALVENSAAVVFSLDNQGNIVYISPGIERLSGFRVDEVIGTSCLEYVLPEDLPGLMSSMERTLAGRPEPYEFRVKHKDGTVHYVLTSSQPLNRDGKPAGLIGVMVDVSEREVAEDALRASEANYRNLFDHTLMGLVVVDAETMKVVLANKSMARILGFGSPEDMVGMEPLDYVLPEDLDWVIGSLTKAMADSSMHELATLRARTEDGRIIWIAGTTSNIDYVRRPSILISLVDVTAAKETELKVAESEEKNRLLVDNAAEGIIVIQDGLLKFANPKCTEISGYTNQELLSRSFLEVVHPDDRQTIAENYIKRIAGEDAPNNYRFRIVDKAGSAKWLQINTVQFGWEGKPAVLSLLTDVTARQEAEEAFRESESRYRLLAENVSDVIWSLNLRTKRVFLSPSVTRLLGYTPEEAQGMKMKELVSPTSYAKALRAYYDLSGKPGNGPHHRASSTLIETELMRKDGSFVWVDISVTMLRDANGQPTEIFGVMRDITQRKKVEEDLRTSEEYFRALIENAWDAIAIVSADGTLLYESPSSARILGYEPEEIVGKNLAEFVRREDIAAIAGTFRKFRTEPGSIVMVDAGFRHKDGHYIECEGTLQNFLHDPKISGVVANYRDVTDRRRAEEAIRNSEERFRNLVEATSDWVWEVDPNGVYIYASPNVRQVLGYEVSEVIGKTVFDYMPVRESSRFSKVFKSYVAKREPFAFVESTRLHKDGRVVTMEISGVPFFSEDGSLLGYRGIGRDITDRKKTEKDLENSLKKVEKTMEATIQAISYTMETRDPYTTGHQKRVTELACAIAKELGVVSWQIDGIRVAGLLHDIGKIAVPTEILSKPGKLSDIEFSMIKAHPKVGFDILKNVDFDWPVARIVVQHHERLDGSGYPYGIPGKDILQEARILAVADVVEAMSSHRPYRPALGIDRALAEVARGEGTLYDSDVVRACSRVIHERGFKFSD